MNKFLLLIAAGLILQATPVFAGHHEGEKGNMFEKHDINGDGSISQDEFLEHAKKKFAEKDTNSDGVISKDEAEAAKAEKKEKWEERRKEMREKMKEKREERQMDDSTE